jgi:ubiquitin-like protein Pup
MPTRDTGEHQHKSRSNETEVEETPATSANASARRDALDADIDAILDDIDEALETNAEEFVRGFVQKGGQ